MKNVYKQIFDLLKQNGYDVYAPAQHKGECVKPYVVVKYEGAIDTLVKADRPVYNIMCYVPQDRYTYLFDMIEDVKKVMKTLYPMLMYEGTETPSYYDDKLKAHMISFQYLNARLMNDWR